jgi:DNA-binding LytR/AlgR family response regulator
MHFSLHRMTHLGRWRREVAVVLAIGAILGWLGPYGTYSCFGVPDRFAYWMARSLLIGVFCLAVIELMSATGSTASWPPMKRALAGVLIASVPSAIIGIALASIFRHAPTSPLEVADLYGRVTIVTAMVGLPLHFVRRPTALAQPALPRPAEATAAKDLFARKDLPAKKDLPARSAFLRRIPARLGTELLCIKVEDHYLRVQTRLGSDLLLLRLSDAVAELDPELGRQVHRSYWVAQCAVVGVERDGHRARLVLTDGARIPVSRTYLPALRKAGWL